MKIMLKSFLFLLLSYTLSGCSDECPAVDEPTPPYEQEIFKFQVEDVGQTDKGYCGKIIVAYTDSLNTSTSIFKAIDLPSTLSTSASVYYTGVLRIHPSTYSCKEGRVDPLPGKPAPTINPHLVDVLSWELKE